jgi:amino acid transporter
MVAFTATLFGYIYTTAAHHSLSYVPLAIVVVVFSVIVGYIAYRGISGSTLTAIVINVIQILSLIAVSIVFIVYRLGHSTKAFELANAGKVVIPHSFMHVLYQSTIAILLLVGFESITALGAEAKNPEKDIRRGVLISLIIQGGFCYLIQYFAANFALGAPTISTVAADGTTVTGSAAAAVDPAPIGTMLRTIGNSSLGGAGQSISLIVAVTVLLALVGTTLACLNAGVRVTYAMSRDKEMPSVLGLLHGKYATPHSGIWVLVGVSALFGIYGVQPKQVDNITQITLASNTGTFLVYGFTCVIAIIAFASRHDKHVIKHYAIPGLGALMNLAELFGVVYLAFKAGGVAADDATKALYGVALWIVLGVVWVAINSRKQRTKLLDSTLPKREAVLSGV